MSAAPKLLTEVLALPEPERAELAAALLASLPPPGALADDDARFVDELDRRADRMLSGEDHALSWDEVRASLRAP